MHTDPTLHSITHIIRSECARQSYTLAKMIHFGSRAAGTARHDSDWDFLLVVVEPLTRKERMELWLPMDTALCRIGIAADILIKSQADYLHDIADIGKITYYAMKTGIEV